MKIIKVGRFAATARTWRAVRAAEILGGKLTVVQGSFNPGGVALSGGTHDEDGVFDFSVRGLTRRQIWRRVRALRTVGFAAWLRTEDEGPWAPHIHAVLIDCANLAPLAAMQVRAYKAGRSGLKSNRADRHAWMHVPVRTFAQYEAEEEADTRDLKRGDTGRGVRELQRALRAHGLDIAIDGQFGPQTEAAVKQIQAARGWPQTGVAGPGVRQVLRTDGVA